METLCRLNMASTNACINLKNFDYSRMPTNEYVNRGKNKNTSYYSVEYYRKNELLYSKNNLNEGQRALFDYIIENPNNIILLQAGPGES